MNLIFDYVKVLPFIAILMNFHTTAVVTTIGDIGNLIRRYIPASWSFTISFLLNIAQARCCSGIAM